VAAAACAARHGGLQLLWANRDHSGSCRRGRGLRPGNADHRCSDVGDGRVCSRSVATRCPRRRRRRALSVRQATDQRLRRPGRVDRSTLRGRPVHNGLTDVPHRRPGALDALGSPGVSREIRRPGQGSGPPDRTPRYRHRTVRTRWRHQCSSRRRAPRQWTRVGRFRHRHRRHRPATHRSRRPAARLYVARAHRWIAHVADDSERQTRRS